MSIREADLGVYVFVWGYPFLVGFRYQNQFEAHVGCEHKGAVVFAAFQVQMVIHDNNIGR